MRGARALALLSPRALLTLALLTLSLGCQGDTQAPPPQPLDHQAELPQAPSATEGAIFTPPGKDQIPDGAFGEAVLRGREIFIDTPKHVGAYLGNDLSCVNCHLNEGRLAGSAPLWAAWVSYPAYRKKNDKVNSIEDRLQGCFTYSLNAQASAKGEAPPPGDPIYTDLQAYMYWLATGAPTGANMPGRGYGEVEKTSQGYDALRGAAVYEGSCQVCHGVDGQGQRAEGESIFPPLWGSRSYNWGAGMHRINTAAAFIQSNMPLGQGDSLSDQEAWDVAAYINTKPRPADPRAKGSTLSKTDALFHDHACNYGEESEGKALGSGTGL